MISYSLLAEALQYYTGLGYKLIEVPWAVSKETLEITCTTDCNPEDNRYLNSYLVGSAEQSFLQLMLDGDLPFGEYCAITPCFRNDVEDQLHQKYFMKLELFHHLRPNTPQAQAKQIVFSTVYTAEVFFRRHVLPISVVSTESTLSLLSYDIITRGVELGSYGLRNHRGMNWVYGTGLAEPRFSSCLGN